MESSGSTSLFALFRWSIESSLILYIAAQPLTREITGMFLFVDRFNHVDSPGIDRGSLETDRDLFCIDCINIELLA